MLLAGWARIGFMEDEMLEFTLERSWGIFQLVEESGHSSHRTQHVQVHWGLGEHSEFREEHVIQCEREDCVRGGRWWQGRRLATSWGPDGDLALDAVRTWQHWVLPCEQKGHWKIHSSRKKYKNMFLIEGIRMPFWLMCWLVFIGHHAIVTFTNIILHLISHQSFKINVMFIRSVKGRKVRSTTVT